MPKNNSPQTLIQSILIPSLPTVIIRTEMNNFHSSESLAYIFDVLIKNSINILRIHSGMKNASNFIFLHPLLRSNSLQESLQYINIFYWNISSIQLFSHCFAKFFESCQFFTFNEFIKQQCTL